MTTPKRDSYRAVTSGLKPNGWDLLAVGFGIAIFIGLAWNAKQLARPFHIGATLHISLAPSHLPLYAGQTVLRMAIALICSLLFTLLVAPLAAKNKHAEKIIIPLIDILQSVPVLAFLSITITGFIYLFPGSLLGPQAAAIFVIFTSQVWNMTLSVYQSLRTVPTDLQEAATMYHLSKWQQFWRIELPFAMPGLLWNTMMSMSAGWFFVVASEAISIADQTILLPGIGSYIAVAIQRANMWAVGYAILTMFVVIVLYDQLLFRPLIKWAEKFKAVSSNEHSSYSWIYNLLGRTRLLITLSEQLAIMLDGFINFFPKKNYSSANPITKSKFKNHLGLICWYLTLVSLALLAAVMMWRFFHDAITVRQIRHVILLGLCTGARVIALIFLCSLIWVPIGVAIGRRPQWVAWAQPIAQFLAAFPANLLFPVVVFGIVHWHLNVEIWTMPLMILGSQWYILFNVIAGTAAIPKELYFAIDNLGVTRALWWRRFLLPGIFPYYLTGAITAAGGAWNASIVAEVISWGDIKLQATGLGAYISEATTQGDFNKIVLGTTVMCLLVLILNRLFWQPLYNLAEKRFGLG